MDIAKTRNGKPPRGTLSLDDARERTPPVDPVAAVKRSLLMTVYGQLGESDVEAITSKMIEQAKAGDAKARGQILGLLAAKDQAGPREIIERVVEVERPVMVSSVAGDQLRALVLYALARNKIMPLPAIAALTGLQETDAKALLQHEWFQADRMGYVLSPIGRGAVE